MDKEKLKRIEELIPLFFAGALTKRERDELATGLRESRECRKLLASEQALFVTAMLGEDNSPLADHPDAESLGQYAWQRDQISASELDDVARHIEKCEICGEILEKLYQLPLRVENLVGEAATPLLDSLESWSEEKGWLVAVVAAIRNIIWKPTVAYAVATLVLLLSFFQPGTEQFISPSLVDVTLSQSLRGDQAPQLVKTTTPQCYLHLKYYADPELGHRYDVEIVRSDAGKTVYSHRDYRNFDNLGYLDVSLLLDTGEYRLVMSDITANDTITVERTFIISLQK